MTFTSLHRQSKSTIYCVYCDLILFHPIVIHACPSFILWNKASTHDPPANKRREERIKIRIGRFPPYVPAEYLQFPVFLLSEWRKAGKSTLPPMRAAVKLQFPVFLLSQRRKTGKSTLPPMRAAVKLQLPVFLLSERRKTGKSSLPPMRAAVKLQFASCFLSEWRKTGKCEFTAHASSGNAVAVRLESQDLSVSK